MDIKTILHFFDVRSGPKGAEGYYEARCPAHQDRKASLIIGPGDKGIRIKCLAGCTTEDVVASAGLSMSDLFYEDSTRPGPKKAPKQPEGKQKAKPQEKSEPEEKRVPRKIVKVYPYTDENGKTVFEVVRYDPKGFSQRVPDRTQPGGYRWSIKDVRPVIYHLPQVISAIQAGKMVYIVEGEKDADSLAMLGETATTSPMGAGKWRKEHSEFLSGADVCIIPDNDEPGRKHAEQVLMQLHGVAKTVRVLDLRDAVPDLPEKGDVSDMIAMLGKAQSAKVLRSLVDAADLAAPPEITPYEQAQALYAEVPGYGVMDGGIVARGKDSVKRLSTFVALPRKIITKDDGVTVEKYFEIDGWTKSGHQLPTISVKAEDFGGMGWVLRNWDFAANVMPGNTVKEQLRYVMTEVGNQSAVRETVYTHVGWRKIGGDWAYLHPGGAIGAEGIRVEIEKALGRYGFDQSLEDDPVSTMLVAYGFRNCMAAHIAIPLMGVAFLAPLREFLEQVGRMPRFALWLKGDSGTMKSTASALALSFFGNFRYSDPMPAGFHETANSIRRKAFVMKDSLLVVDDFHPETSLQERRKMESLVQALSRAYGNGESRGRMTSDRKLEDAMPARGMAIMSGEQAPDVGPSGAIRFYMVGVEKGDIQINPQLEAMQDMAERGYLRKAMAEYITWLARRVDNLPGDLLYKYSLLIGQAHKAENADAHGRAAEAVAHVMLGYEMMLDYMVDIGAMPEEAARREHAAAWEIIMHNSRQQTDEAREDSPVNMFLTAVQQLLASSQATVKDVGDANPAITPPSSIGYRDQHYYYLFPDVTFARVCKLYSDQARVFPLGKNALFRQLKNDGIIVPDSQGKCTRSKRIGVGNPRMLWIHRARLEGTDGKMPVQSGEQLGMIPVDPGEVDNPF